MEDVAIFYKEKMTGRIYQAVKTHFFTRSQNFRIFFTISTLKGIYKEMF